MGVVTTKMQSLGEILQLENVGHDSFLARNNIRWAKEVFGGQVIAQALAAAACTTDRPVHSVHNYFLSSGDVNQPIRFAVERIRDGGSFSVRQIRAWQGERLIALTTASFHDDVGSAMEHQATMPAVLPPDKLINSDEWPDDVKTTLPQRARKFYSVRRELILRPTDPSLYVAGPSRKALAMWFKARDPIGDAAYLHQGILVMGSDMGIVGTALLPHGKNIFMPKHSGISLDHAVWFHRPFRAHSWLLFYAESPTLYAGRGLCRGAIFTEDGVHIASICQEALLRTGTE